MTPADAAEAAAALDAAVGRRCGDWLTAQEAADTTQCAMVAPVVLADVTKRPPPPGGEPLPVGEIDLAVVARQAQATGVTEAAAFIAASAGADMTTPTGRATIRDAWRAADPSTTVKRRLVERLDLTANDSLAHMGVSFARATDALAGTRPGDHLMVDDAVDAYRAMPLHSSLARWLCTRCPATGRVYRPRRLPFGYVQSCAAYSAFTAVIKEACRLTPAARGGGIEAAASVASGLAGYALAATTALRDAAAQGRISCTGVVDDIFGSHPATLNAQVYQLREAVFALAGYTRSPTKHRAGPDVNILGLWTSVHPLDGPTISIAGPKIRQTLTDLYKLRAIGDHPTAAHAGVPVAAYEKFVGDVSWWAQADEGVALRCPGIRAALHIAKERRFATVPLNKTSPAYAPIRAILERCENGATRASRVVPLADTLSTFRVTVSAGPDGLQAGAAAAPRASVMASASDASLSDGTVAWALLTTDAAGKQRLTRGSRPAATGESSASAELEAIRVASQHFADIRGSTFVPLMDALAAVQALLGRRAQYGSPTFNAIQEILLNAERHAVQILPLWVPRTLNTLADATTHLSPAAAAGWARQRGIRRGGVSWAVPRDRGGAGPR